jgi:hypothetical protein
MKHSVHATAGLAGVVIALLSSVALAGVVDSPLPELEPGKKTLFL